MRKRTILDLDSPNTEGSHGDAVLNLLDRVEAQIASARLAVRDGDVDHLRRSLLDVQEWTGAASALLEPLKG